MYDIASFEKLVHPSYKEISLLPTLPPAVLTHVLPPLGNQGGGNTTTVLPSCSPQIRSQGREKIFISRVAVPHKPISRRGRRVVGGAGGHEERFPPPFKLEVAAVAARRDRDEAKDPVAVLGGLGKIHQAESRAALLKVKGTVQHFWQTIVLAHI